MSEDKNREFFERANDALRYSWEVHRQAFGPILEPAFKDDLQTRVKLIAALNHISRRELKRGLDILQEIRERCIYDEDTAAWSFFVGLCFELAGDKEHMMHCYNASASFNHRFYMPYLKMARLEHIDAEFDLAYQHYCLAIDCLGEMPEDQRDEDSLAAAYANLTSCLTMMHRYREAEQMFIKTMSAPRQAKGASAAAAVLYAAMGKHQKVNEQIEILEKQNSDLLENTKAMTEQILDGKHAHFAPVEIDPQQIQEFWLWFCSNEKDLRQSGAADAAAMISGSLKKCFSFMDREPQTRVLLADGKVVVVLKDFYAIGLHFGYGKLLEACPQVLNVRWRFAIEH